MNAEKGDKCCDITQESLLINGDQDGDAVYSQNTGCGSETPKERKAKREVLVNHAGFQLPHFHFLKSSPSHWAPRPPDEPAPLGV